MILRVCLRRIEFRARNSRSLFLFHVFPSIFIISPSTLFIFFTMGTWIRFVVVMWKNTVSQKRMNEDEVRWMGFGGSGRGKRGGGGFVYTYFMPRVPLALNRRHGCRNIPGGVYTLNTLLYGAKRTLESYAKKRGKNLPFLFSRNKKYKKPEGFNNTADTSV